MKPTYGTVSRYGLIAYASSLDQMGPIAGDAADCAAVLDAVMGKDPRDGTSLEGDFGHLLERLTGDLSGTTVGIPVDCFGDGLNDEVRRQVLAVSDVLKVRGAQVKEFSFPVMQYVVPTYYIIAAAEASSNLSRFDGVKYGWRAEGYGDLRELYQQTRTRGLRPRGPAADPAGHLRALLRLLRRLLPEGSASKGDDQEGLRRGILSV